MRPRTRPALQSKNLTPFAKRLFAPLFVRKPGFTVCKGPTFLGFQYCVWPCVQDAWPHYLHALTWHRGLFFRGVHLTGWLKRGLCPPRLEGLWPIPRYGSLDPKFLRLRTVHIGRREG
jgi:hypothetical protein